MNIYIVVDSSGKSNVFFVLIEKFVVYYIAKGGAPGVVFWRTAEGHANLQNATPFAGNCCRDR